MQDDLDVRGKARDLSRGLEGKARDLWDLAGDSAGRTVTRRDLLAAGAAGSAVLYLAACGGSSGGSSTTLSKEPVTINNLFMQQAGYSPQDLAGMTKAFEKKYSNITVNNTLVPYEALHDKIVAAAPAGTYDVVLGDCIWPAEFGSKGIVQDISDDVNSLPVKDIFPGAIQMALYQGKYYGQPWILDTKYLYYNQQMCSQAGVSGSDFKTLDGMVAALKKIKQSGVVQYPWIGSWDQAEAVICDYAQFLGAYDGKFLDSSGKAVFNTGGGVKALEFMKMLLDDGLANPASTSSLEDDVVKSFSQGQNAANLNWTFQLATANDPKQSKVAGQCVIAHTPAGPTGKAPGCNGGQPVMISRTAEHPAEAWAFIKFISSQAQQNQYSTVSLPIWGASYSDPAVIKQAGKDLVDVAKTQLPDLILRPQVPNYNACSAKLQVEIQNALLGKSSVQDALNTAADFFDSNANA
jgi:multiple sugar transport system substrate-binding protein